ncbi:excinuclease ABC subunit UvrA [Paludisphaera borealis]|uniref:UvrABC system protein A n=1 Tax=Paludisphaera borealis TaxID=1387353 RepID=A0A1U7CV16_9BACT|nr:excinuclease ABC subunit UvrA [Paludisphaera borealis]APW62790.1 UvrABC system protein A [Paludisphaera borealis]
MPTPRSESWIRLRGARTHNLRAIDLDLPLGRLIAVTGVSGAGKSSLAFDTLYAEGQRRYVETFSAYARQFLEPLEKPDADRIESIPPAIALAARESRPSGRSTVGTITELHDYLGLLFTRHGRVVCRTCGEPVVPATPRSVSQAIETLPAGHRYEVVYPVEILAETDVEALGRGLLEQGLTRVRLGDRLIDLTTESLNVGRTEATPAVQIEVVVDRLTRGKDSIRRRLDSIETAFTKGLGRCRIVTGSDSWTFVRGWRCSRCGTDHLEPQPNLFRYTSPLGACPRCEGLGSVVDLDMAKIVPDPSKSLREGAVAAWNTPAHRGLRDQLIVEGPALGLPVSVPFQNLDAEQVRILVEGVPAAGFPGLAGFFERLDRKSYKVAVRVFLSRWRRYRTCPDCQGARLRPEALAVRIEGTNIAEFSALSVGRARELLESWGGLDDAGMGRLRAPIAARLDYLTRIGVGYLTLDRPSRTISAGELRRVTMVKTLGSGLVGTLYVLDEPTIGLHAHDVGRLVGVLQALRDEGNTLVVVDHEADVVRASDHVVDLGPGAGDAGGRVLYSGPVAGLDAVEGSATSDFLAGRRRIEVPKNRRKPSRGVLTLKGASGHNLKDVDAAFPLGVLCVVTGVSGAGKSTLVEETLYPALRKRLADEILPVAPFVDLTGTGDLAEAVFLDQSPIGRSGRSNPVTYLKAFDEIRRTFAATHDAKLRNYGAGTFSFNIEGGRCSACKGDGFRRIDMQFLPDVMVRCPDCKGTRYRPEVLEITYRGKNIAEVLDLTGREAFAFFRNRPKIQSRLRPLLDIGLDYLRLGQPAAMLSGGEAQRLKLAAFLGSSTAALNRAGNVAHTLFILDEPTAGLHPSDMIRLIEALNSLVDRGHSVLVVEHSPEIMISADWIIDLGPEAGDDGGRIVAEGTPEDVAKAGTLTGVVVAKALAQASEGGS